MKTWLKRIAAFLALSILAITFYNASWLAPEPSGPVKLIANRGLYQAYDHSGIGSDGCTATRIEQPVHNFQENTIASIERAGSTGAVMIAVDVAPTSDGEIVLFRDNALDCRTDGTRDVRDRTLEQLQALDIGHGYTADDGATFPFRGKHVGDMPALAQAIEAAPEKRFIFNFTGDDPAEADLLARKLEEAGRRVDNYKDGFYGAAAPVARMRELYPEAWAFTAEGAEQCLRDYRVSGWFGIVPASCVAARTIFIPLSYQWAMPGWPNRTIQRMEDAGVEMIIVASTDPDLPRGIDLPEQLGKVPSTYNGWLWVDDMYAVGPALRPTYNTRSDDEEEALARALDRRRAKRN